MADISILTLDQIGNGLAINQSTSKLDVLLSEDPRNMLRLSNDNKLFINGIYVEKIPDGNNIVWSNVTISDPAVRSGLADSSNLLQIGKDLAANIWIRGAITNTGASIPANTLVFSIPSEFEISNYPDSGSFYQMAPVQSTLAGNTTALFLRMQYYNYLQNFAFSGALATNVSFIFQPTIIGRAKTLFKDVFVDTSPSYKDVTWTSLGITNVNAASGLPDLSNPLQIGKDTIGNVWMRGAVTNIGTAIAANGVVATLPVTHQLLGYASSSSFCQLTAVQSTLAGNTTALFLRMKNLTNVQTIAFSGSMASGVSFVMQPTIIGRLKV